MALVLAAYLGLVGATSGTIRQLQLVVVVILRQRVEQTKREGRVLTVAAEDLRPLARVGMESRSADQQGERFEVFRREGWILALRFEDRYALDLDRPYWIALIFTPISEYVGLVLGPDLNLVAVQSSQQLQVRVRPEGRVFKTTVGLLARVDRVDLLECHMRKHATRAVTQFSDGASPQAAPRPMLSLRLSV